ncbi:MAG: sigma 54-interacting transcriptional regulator [Syntrophobacteraceae bacterium]|jgi:transcriptional regulator with PAS, ATPase and Fis domain
MIRIKDLLNEEGKKVASSGGTAIYLTDGSAFTLGVNKDYEKLTEIEEREVIGRNMHALEEDRFFDRSVTLLVLKNKAPMTIPQRILRTSKKVVVTGNPIFNQAGDVIYVVTSVYPEELCNEHPQHGEHPSPSFTAMDNMVAASKIMQKVFLRAVQVAAMDATVLILGESGVGKGVLSTVIHQFSPRRSKPFVKVNMTAIPEDLFESELFGYRGGSFTGALKAGKPGFLQAAAGGTLFLDEISEVSPRGQAKLLKVIEEKEIYRVGSTIPEQVDVRFVAASNRSLKDLVAEGKFREDLYYRLNVVPIHIPPLRERPEDIFALANHALKNLSNRYNIHKILTPSAVLALTDYDWPGNVRELHNVMERLVILCGDTRITSEHVLDELGMALPSDEKVPFVLQGDYKCAVDCFEKKILAQVMEQYNGNLYQASAALGMHRTTLLRKLRKYKLGFKKNGLVG